LAERGSSIGGSTRVVGIIGWPVAHSLSPAIHNAAFRSAGLDWTYVPLPVAPGRVPQALDGLVALGLAGANVTMPHKSACAARCDRLSDDAERLGAVNTLVIEEDLVHGHNTDAPGFDRFLRRDIGFQPAGRTALVYGAGGAARAVALSLARGGLGRLTVAVRDPAKAEDLGAALGGLPTEVVVIGFDRAAEETVDLAVNATPLDGEGGSLPLPRLGPEVVVVDLHYVPPVTPLQAEARAAGAQVFGGLGLLLNQAAIAYELWTGAPAPLDTMSAAALGALAEAG
jgi:shikimate dehydrogenase